MDGIFTYIYPKKLYTQMWVYLYPTLSFWVSIFGVPDIPKIRFDPFRAIDPLKSFWVESWKEVESESLVVKHPDGAFLKLIGEIKKRCVFP